MFIDVLESSQNFDSKILVKYVVTSTCYFTRATVAHKSISCVQTAAIAITSLTWEIACKARAGTSTIAANVPFCTIVLVITCYAFDT